MTGYSRMAIAGLVLLSAGQAGAEVLWRGDFESGDLSQWSKAQEVAPDRLQLEESDVAQGRYALKAVVQQGDDPIDASGNRSEVAYVSYEQTGAERFYRWQTKFADDYPSVDRWQLFTQWHHAGSSGSPPVEFFVRGEKICLNVSSELVWSMPLQRGRWIDFVFHVRWSPDPSEGFVELYVDGQKVLDRLPARTQFPGELNYLKQGLYRDEAVSQVGVVYHDGMTIGTELADVMPAAAPAETPADATAAATPAASGDGTSAGLTPEQAAQFASASGCGSNSVAGAPMLGVAFAALGLLWRKRRR